MNIEVLQGDQVTTIDFDVDGISSECPQLEAQVWLEVPETHVFTQATEADMKVTASDAELRSGKVQKSFSTSKFSGDYYAHVSVSPTGFECAMAMVEECTDVFVQYDCAAVLNSFSAAPGINTEKGDAKTYNGPDGIFHVFDWDVSDLWNCDLYAVYSVVDESGTEEPVSGRLDWAELIEFTQTDSTRTIYTHTSYYSYYYTITFYHTADDSVYTSQSTSAANPHPACDITGAMTTSLELVAGQINVHHDWTLNPLYTCSIAVLSADLYDEDFETLAVSTVSDKLTTVPEGLPELVYANFPIEVVSTLELSDQLSGQWALNSTASIFPACAFDVKSISWTHEITVTGGVPELRLYPQISAEVGPYCGEIKGVIKTTVNGNPAETRQVDPEDISPEPSFPSMIVLPYGPGNYCATLELSTVGPDASGNIQTHVSDPICYEEVTPECVLSATSQLDKTVDHAAQTMTYSLSNAYEASEWCQAGTLSVEAFYKRAEQDDSHWTALALDESLGATRTIDEQDIDFETKFVVSFSDSVYGQLDQRVEALATDSHQETCRPSIAAADIVMNSISLSDAGAYKLDVAFDYKFGGTGMHNCVDLEATYQLHATSGVAYEQKSFTGQEILDASSDAQTQVQIIDEIDDCWYVTVSYGEAGNSARWSTESSTLMCHRPVCEFEPSIAHVAT